jgi:O-antigen/teichoic acid export membrane protein
MLGKITVEQSWQSLSAGILAIWKADSLRGRFARGASWSIGGAFIAQGSNLAASIIVARFLGQTEFGKYGMIQSTVGMLGIFAGLGLGVTATKYVAEYRTRDPERAGRIIALGCVVAILSGGLLAVGLLAYAPLLAANTLREPKLADELRIGCALLFLNAFNGAQIGALSGFEAFKAIARINLARGLFSFPLTVAAVLVWRLPGAIWALAITVAFTCILSQVSLQTQCRAFGIHPRISTCWTEKKVLWTFSTPAFLCGAMAGPAIWAASTILVKQPGGYAEMGVFSAATQWRNAIGFVPSVLAQFALPLLSNLNGDQDVLRYAKALRWNLILTGSIGIAVALPVAVLAAPIMRLYGGGFQQGGLVLVLSAATAVIACLNAVVGTAILSSGSVWAGFAFNAMWASVLLVGCYYFIPTHLAVGLAGSLLCAYLAHTVWQSVYLRQRSAAWKSENAQPAPEICR